MNYYDEYKWCRKCNRYVNFLLSMDYSYCIHCDARVVVFSKDDFKKFHRTPPLVG